MDVFHSCVEDSLEEEKEKGRGAEQAEPENHLKFWLSIPSKNGGWGNRNHSNSRFKTYLANKISHIWWLLGYGCQSWEGSLGEVRSTGTEAVQERMTWDVGEVFKYRSSVDMCRCKFSSQGKLGLEKNTESLGYLYVSAEIRRIFEVKQKKM